MALAPLVTGLALLAWVIWVPSPIRAPAQGVVLTNVTIVNPGGERRGNQTLVVRGDAIDSIRATRPDDFVPPTRRYEGSYVLPGLIDMAARLVPPPFDLRTFVGLLFLRSGVTSVRDTGDFPGDLQTMQREVAAGELAWPRVFGCVRVLEGAPPTCPRSRVVRDPADARAAVDEVARGGASCIKVGHTFPTSLLGIVGEAAAEHRLPVVVADAAAGALIGAVPAIEVEGGGAPTPSEASGGGACDVSTAEPLRAADLARARATPFTYAPCIASRARWLSLVDRQHSGEVPGAGVLPRLFLDILWNPAAILPRLCVGPGAVDVTRNVISELRRAGVRLRAGGGCGLPLAVPGLGLQAELGELARSGLTLEEVWTVATRDAGDALGVPMLGTLQDGAPADFLVFREDPTRAVAAVGTLEAVVAQGRLYPIPALDRALMARHEFLRGPVIGWALSLTARVLTWWKPVEYFDCQFL